MILRVICIIAAAIAASPPSVVASPPVASSKAVLKADLEPAGGSGTAARFTRAKGASSTDSPFSSCCSKSLSFLVVFTTIRIS